MNLKQRVILQTVVTEACVKLSRHKLWQKGKEDSGHPLHGLKNAAGRYGVNVVSSAPNNLKKLMSQPYKERWKR